MSCQNTIKSWKVFEIAKIKRAKIPKNSKIYLLEVIKNPDRSKNHSSHGMFVSCIMYEDPLAETSISKNR